MTTKSKRIEYIDATRGFTMVLVVIWHIVFYSYHEGAYTFDTYCQAIFKFFMPLFFFISGFVQTKLDQQENLQIVSYIKNKFMALVIPTLSFLFFYDILFNISIEVSLFHSLKSGYWFTIVLFEFIVLYVILSFAIRKIKSKITANTVWIIIIVCTLFLPESYRILKYVLPVSVLDLFSVNQFHFFIFFWGGVILRKYAVHFYNLTNNGIIVAIIILVFIIDLVISNRVPITLPSIPFVLLDKMRYILSGALGSIIVFTFFRKNKNNFTQNSHIGRWLQYVGRRSLDVYLLHYFFIPRNLEIIGQFFKTYTNPSIEFFVSLSLAVWIIILCLATSNILRISSFFERYLFGVKPINAN